MRLPDRHLEAIYYDTAEFGLVRNRITLRYRSGEDGPPWTVKLPEASSGVALRRREVSFDGAPGRVPPQAANLVRAYTRSRPLVRVARLKTDRTPVEIRGPDGGRLAEITDNRVAVYGERGRRTGSFREIEVEIHAQGRAGRRLMRAAIGRLVAAGCRAEPPIPKVLRALGQPASGPPDVVVPPIGADETVSTLIRYATSRSVTQILRHDPGVRLGEDPEDVHQFRVATRRLRSDLRTFAPLLDPEPAGEVRGRLRQLGAKAGAARDTDVLADRLRATADMLPEQDAVGVEQLLRRLDDQAARLAPRSCRSSAALTTTSCSTPSWSSPRGRRSPPRRPAWPRAGRRSGRRLDPATLATAETRRQGPWKGTHPTLSGTRSASGPSDAATRPRPSHRSAAARPGGSPRRSRRSRTSSAITKTQLSPRHGCATRAPLSSPCVVAGELITSVRRDRARLRSKWPKAWKRASARTLRRWLAKRPSPHRTPAEHPRSVARRATPRPNRRGRAGPLPSLNLPRGSCRESRACLVIPASGDPSPKGR